MKTSDVKMVKIAALVPCYNEKMTIAKVICDLKKVLPDVTIYVYDNNSLDGSDAIAVSNGAVLRYETKQGKGNVIRTMLREIDAECYIIVDADDTYSLDKAREMCDLVLNKGCDMVIGDRLSSTYFTENKRLFHNFGNSLVKNIINSFFNADVKDIMTGFRCLSYNFAKTFPVLSKGFEIETEMTIHAVYHNMNISNVVINYKDRPKESPSKLNTISDGINVILMVFRLYKDYKPLQLFSLISLVLFLLATVLFAPIIIEFKNTGLVPRFPTLIVSCFVYLASIISLFAGFILSSIVEKGRRDFERSLLVIDGVHKVLSALK